MEEKVTVASMRAKQTARLDHKVQIAIGMRAMVLINIATEADIANGTRGIIQDIILDSRETIPESSAMEVKLKYPPAAIIFKPDVPSDDCIFPGLTKGLIPIIPSEGGFTIHLQNGSTTHVHRRQLALTPAYAFTHHKCQGQTIEYVIVDLGKPPSGTLDPFNAYVALSRSRGRGTIRLLRRGESDLFTTHPSVNELKREDERLYRLSEMTRRKFEEGLYHW